MVNAKSPQIIEIPGYRIIIIPLDSSNLVNPPQLSQEQPFFSGNGNSANATNTYNHVSDNTQPQYQQQNFLGFDNFNNFRG